MLAETVELTSDETSFIGMLSIGTHANKVPAFAHPVALNDGSYQLLELISECDISEFGLSFVRIHHQQVTFGLTCDKNNFKI